jgi:hypothetical protein
VEERRPDDRLPARARELRIRRDLRDLVVGRAEQEPRCDLDDAAVERRERACELEELVPVGDAARRRLVVVGEEVRRRERRRPAERARGHALAYERRHRGSFRRRRGALEGVGAHDVEPNRGMPDERRHVDAEPALLDGVQVLRIALPRPRDRRAERVERHALDEAEEPHDRVAVLRAARRQREAAVAHHDGRDAVPRRRSRVAIPEELAVVVRVEVDEARREGEPPGVDLARAALGVTSDGGDASRRHRDVAAERRTARTVDDLRVANDEVGHGRAL